MAVDFLSCFFKWQTEEFFSRLTIAGEIILTSCPTRSSTYLTTSLKTSSCWLIRHQSIFLFLLHSRCYWGKSRKLVNKAIHWAYRRNNSLLAFEWWHQHVPKWAKSTDNIDDSFSLAIKSFFCWAFVSLLTWKGCRPSAYPHVTELWCHCWPLSFNSRCPFWCYDSPLETLHYAITSPHIWDM